MDLVLAEQVFHGRHDAIASRADTVSDLLFPATVEPDTVGEVGRSERGVAFRLGTVSGNTIGLVVSAPGLRIHVVGSAAGQ